MGSLKAKVFIMMFSDRIGVTKTSLELYVDSIPDSLKNSIWNFILELYPLTAQDDEKRKLCLYLAKHFRKSRVDEVPSRSWDVSDTFHPMNKISSR